MAGSDPQSSDQFSLVSLEKSQKAANSYSSMSRRVRGESENTLSINEEEAQEKAAAAKTPPPKAKPKADDSDTKKKQAKKKPPPLEGDRIDQSIDDVLAKLEEFNHLVSTLFTNMSQAGKNLALVVLTPLIPLLNKLLQLLNGPIQFINLLTRKINEKMGGKKRSGSSQSSADGATSEAEEMEEADAAPPEINAKQANYSDMLELNILFTDNMKKPLYKKKPNAGTARLGAMEEDLIMSNAILAINECAEFTLELPNPSSGLYAGQRIYDIMANVTKEDVAIFLGFVKAFPGKYIGKEWKISETFATWLINNAPTAE
ncbi:hypothetical protein COW36_00090 [bacterium (Candidatus Blackallbacteria) CG17_big_fil_post_rev_8_21_14_2_50_48_46]|uniref:Uncharacterized protein n=1 Tax=bacterium (Candidatus Blackallbacteria) CG17_big_fil_post_rev_8_21_14_2_50_48_46 TaxID=2014261 RepID=A0A2M7GBV8_9BACT|nr:MAG: hypothetical protein COW64_07800 [bacterium (Candidatus Blackallbacteria) CG18_big_fil_WC_8_21_14_2_50_49_26]PIW19666.1 MAG: hypothetical protein COW36_00090 [bacterium (Candidatus Blackallbacteria) CG17_big_fil_post_rev_8_21_14_2_50_48_46]PIW44737.1 MAG: hypothetical protein COW20_23005 [bacterium (Candidatus Blackallbacteria) CG13_big_fil_rev_8_21_14_2_50_49_14]